MTTTLNKPQSVAALKHLAGGKTLEIVATILHTTRDDVFELARNHGYPDKDKLAWAADILEKKLDEADAIPEHPDPASVIRGQQKGAPQTPPAGASTPSAGGPTSPDEIRALINTGKGHPSKRIQSAADRVIDAVDRLKALIAEDHAKNAEKRRAAAEKEQARAEVARLKEQLRKAQAKLRGNRAPAKKVTSSDRPGDEGPTAAEIRAWAVDNDIDCPHVGRVPQRVREAYETAHEGDDAAGAA